MEEVVTFRERIIHHATKTVNVTEPLPIRRQAPGPNDISAAKLLAAAKKAAAGDGT